MAAALAQYPLNTALKFLQHIHRNKGLRRSGETAAMDTVGAPAFQEDIA